MHLMIVAASSFALPSFETLRFATLLRMRWKSERLTKHSQVLRSVAKRSVSKGGHAKNVAQFAAMMHAASSG
jgi:hypothetical protein